MQHTVLLTDVTLVTRIGRCGKSLSIHCRRSAMLMIVPYFDNFLSFVMILL